MKINELLEEVNKYRPLSKIADDIIKDWSTHYDLFYAAAPYVDEMLKLDKLTSAARKTVSSFLLNISKWNTPPAKKIKDELKAMLDNKPVKESLLAEGINFHVMQQAIYDYVLKKMKELNPTMHFSYATELAKTTDKFFTDKFDAAHEAFNKAESIEDIEDALQSAIQAASETIAEYFEDESNHPAGYSARKIVSLEYDTPTRDELDKLIKRIDPQLEKELEKF